MNKTYETKKGKSNEQLVMSISIKTLIANIILSIGKAFAGVVANSGAMISDAIHSASDVFSTILVMVGYKMSEKKADAKHPYGHERLECVAAIVLSIILAATGIGIGYSGINIILSGEQSSLAVPGTLALIAAIASIAVKEWMYWYTRNAAKTVNSGALMADAWHHRSDALSSVGSLVGILSARMGFPLGDPIASVIICVCIVKAAIEIFKDAIDKMVDTSCDEYTVNNYRKIILEEDGVLQIDMLNTRMFSSKAYIDVEISIDKEASFSDAHDITESVHTKIKNTFNEVKHCMVHANPK